MPHYNDALAKIKQAEADAEANRKVQEEAGPALKPDETASLSAGFIAAKDAEIAALRERLESLDRKVSVITEAAMETAVIDPRGAP